MTELTVRHFEHGAALFGSIPLDHMDAWFAWAKEMNYDFVDAWASGHLGAVMAFTSKASGDKFRTEIGIDLNSEPKAGVTMSIGFSKPETIGERVAQHMMLEKMAEEVNNGALDEGDLKVSMKKRIDSST